MRILLAPSRLTRILGVVVATSLLGSSAACSGSNSGLAGLGKAVGPGGKTYAVGDEVHLGPSVTGYFCETIDSGGTRNYPNTRHYAIARIVGVEDNTSCETAVSAFRSFIPAAADFSLGYGVNQWQGMIVTLESGYAGQLGGYKISSGGLSTSPVYGKMAALAAGF